MTSGTSGESQLQSAKLADSLILNLFSIYFVFLQFSDQQVSLQIFWVHASSVWFLNMEMLMFRLMFQTDHTLILAIVITIELLKQTLEFWTASSSMGTNNNQFKCCSVFFVQTPDWFQCGLVVTHSAVQAVLILKYAIIKELSWGDKQGHASHIWSEVT